MVRAGFKGHVGGGLAQVGTALQGVPQGHGLGMGFTDALRVPFADALAIGRHDHATHPWVGVRHADRLVCEFQGPRHPAVVSGDVGGGWREHARSLKNAPHQGWCCAVTVFR
jgi:hypothetical protein